LARHILPDRNVPLDEAGEGFWRIADDLHCLLLDQREDSTTRWAMTLMFR
jgi:hypothetical protein